MTKMFNSNLYVLCVFLFVSIGCSTASAKTPVELQGKLLIPSLTVHANPENPVNSDFAVIDLHLAVKVWTLLGHPVFMCTGWWEVKSVRVAGATFYGTEGYSNQLPVEVIDGIRIWDSRFQVPIRSAGNGTDINLQCGAGEFWKAGLKRPSLNVPDSVAWGKLFHRSYVGVPGVTSGSVVDFFARPLSAQTAKEIMTDSQARIVINTKGGQGFNHSNVLALKLDLSAVYGWMKKGNSEQQSTLKNTLAKQKSQKPRSLDEVFDAVDVHQKITAVKKQETTLAKFENKTAPVLKQSQIHFSNSLKNKHCANTALSPKHSMALSTYIDQQQVATADCLEVKKLIPKRDSKSQLWGYVTDAGKWHIKPSFKTASEFRNGYAIVSKKIDVIRRFGIDKHYGVVNHLGEAVIPLQWEYVEHQGQDFKVRTNQSTRTIREYNCETPGIEENRFQTGLLNAQNEWIQVLQWESTRNKYTSICLNVRYD